MNIQGCLETLSLSFYHFSHISSYMRTMLAEVGRVSDSLKYCQTILKLKTHQQGGYSVNLVSTKFVGKLLNLFDSTAHRVVGGLPPPAPSTYQGSTQV
ncbi:hypothetical protein L3X38_027780 [Prunus dulcis]|uniref:Uncharacterized protein n=1 Tax=Prunus dulcis TaxID=3755 RepID=A0AAD4VNQ4_PRUDU|nr:hypothetical protein L3X38_027780 [Prunus dulcis]